MLLEIKVAAPIGAVGGNKVKTRPPTAATPVVILKLVRILSLLTFT